MKRTILGIILCFSLLINNTAFALPEGLWEDSGRIENVFGDKNNEDILTEKDAKTELVENLNILVPENYESDVTYSDFLKSIAKILGFNADVSADVLFEKYKNEGILLSDTMPSKVKMREAVYAGVNIINISGVAKTEQEYYNAAVDNGLLEGISYSAKENISYNDYMHFLYNLLTADVHNVVDIKDNQIYIDYESEKTILSERFEIHEIKGIFNAYSFTDIYGKSDLNEGYAEIDKVKYECKADAEKLIGKRVKAYVNEEDNIIFAAEEYKNEEKSFNSMDLENCAENEISFYNGSRVDRIKLSSGTRVIYNKIYNGIYTKNTGDFLKSRPVEVTAIDNDTDGIFDVLKIIDYETFTVKSDVGMTGRIYFDYGEAYREKEYIETDIDDKVVIKKDSLAISAAEIKKGDIISVLSGRNLEGKTFTEIIVSSQKITGSVTAVYNEEPYYDIAIDGEKYRLNYDYAVKAGFSSKSQNSKIVKAAMGLFAQFSLDAFGNIADCVKTSESEQVGYLIRIVNIENDNPDISEETITRAKIMTQSGEIVQLDFKEKVTLYYSQSISGEKVTAYQAFNAIKNELLGDVRCIILYKTNSIGLITHIYLPIDNLSGNISDYPLTLDYAAASDKEMRYYTGTLGGMYIAKSTTPMFSVPSAENASDDKLYKVSAIGGNGNDYYYRGLRLYSCDTFSQPRVVLYQSDSAEGGSVKKTESFSVIDKFTNTIDEDDMSIKQVHYWSNGTYKTSTVTDTEMVSTSNNSEGWEKNVKITDLKFGDTVQFAVTDTNEISAFKVMHRKDNLSDKKITDENGIVYKSVSWLPILMLVCGEIEDNKDNLIKVKVGEDVSWSFSISANAKVYLVDSKSKQIILSSFKEVQQGDVIAARRNYHTIVDLVIYR